MRKLTTSTENFLLISGHFKCRFLVRRDWQIWYISYPQLELTDMYIKCIYFPLYMLFYCQSIRSLAFTAVIQLENLLLPTEKRKVTYLFFFLSARLIQFSIYQGTRKLENSSEFLKYNKNKINKITWKKINKKDRLRRPEKKYKIKMEKNNARVAFATFCEMSAAENTNHVVVVVVG